MTDHVELIVATNTAASLSGAVPTEKAAENHMPGEPGLWVFIMGDMVVFSLFFLTFLVYRGANIELYNSSQQMLNMHFGAINTLFLLASSWFVVTAIQAVRQGRDRLAQHLLGGAFLCGLAFCVVKVIEYRAKVAEGASPLENEFLMFYFTLTGIHFLHLLVGMGVLIFMWFVLRRDGPAIAHKAALEGGATYWHLVDLLWIIIFPLLYLLH